MLSTCSVKKLVPGTFLTQEVSRGDGEQENKVVSTHQPTDRPAADDPAAARGGSFVVRNAGS